MGAGSQLRPLILKVGMNWAVTISAPNDVIWKQELYFLMVDNI
jgi:hypothetical protein